MTQLSLTTQYDSHLGSKLTGQFPCFTSAGKKLNTRTHSHTLKEDLTQRHREGDIKNYNFFITKYKQLGSDLMNLHFTTTTTPYQFLSKMALRKFIYIMHDSKKPGVRSNITIYFKRYLKYGSFCTNKLFLLVLKTGI